MKASDDILIDKMRNALGKAAYDSGKVLDPNAWWPLNYLMYRSLFFADYYRELLEDYETARKRFSLKRVAKTFKYPTAIWLAMVNLPATMKTLGFKKPERIKTTVEFIEMLQMRMAGSVFCEDNKNIVWDNNKVCKVMEELQWINVKDGKKLRHLFERLHANLISLNEAVYWNANCSTREVHGPYEVVFEGHKAQLIIREFYNFYASDLEPLLKNFPYQSCITYTLYDTDLVFDFPVLNDYAHDISLSDHTLAVYGEVKTIKDTKRLKTVKNLEKICNDFEKKGVEISYKVESMDRERQVVESVRRLYYRVHKLKELLGKDWQPPKKQLKKIEEALETFPVPKWRELTREQYLNITDPRID